VIEEYNEIADRCIDAARAALDDDVPEAAGFLTYHAFESAGGALVTHLGMAYSKSHKGKLNQFSQAANQLGDGFIVAQLAIKLGSSRGKFLYPETKADGTVARPRDFITRTQATKLRSRVRGIVHWVRDST